LSFVPAPDNDGKVERSSDPVRGSKTMSTTTNESNDATQESQPPGSEQQHAGNSGEGAASALAHLKTQTRQHRRLGGDSEELAGGSSQ
jgi:hypothetical protein